MIENNSSKQINLSGPWQFRIGGNTEWREIHVPSSWESQGISFQVEGPVVYRKEFVIPGEWAGCQILLHFDAVSYACEVFCNNIRLGSHQGLWTPFTFDISSVIVPGASNTIELEVYKPGNRPSSRYPVRSCLAGFLPDLGGTFGGIWQSVTISAHQAAITDLQVTTEFKNKAIQIKCEGRIYHLPIANLEWKLQIFHHDEIILDEQHPYHEANPLSRRLVIDPIQNWSPENPRNVYRYCVYCSRNDSLYPGLPNSGVSAAFGRPRPVAAQWEPLPGSRNFVLGLESIYNRPILFISRCQGRNYQNQINGFQLH